MALSQKAIFQTNTRFKIRVCDIASWRSVLLCIVHYPLAPFCKDPDILRGAVLTISVIGGVESPSESIQMISIQMISENLLISAAETKFSNAKKKIQRERCFVLQQCKPSFAKSHHHLFEVAINAQAQKPVTRKAYAEPNPLCQPILPADNKTCVRLFQFPSPLLHPLFVLSAHTHTRWRAKRLQSPFIRKE